MFNQTFVITLQKVFKNHFANINKNMIKTKKMTKKTISVDMRTASEIERERKHQRICSDYLKLRSDYPDASVYRIFGVIAGEVGMTPMGVMRVLQRRNLYHIQRTR